MEDIPDLCIEHIVYFLTHTGHVLDPTWRIAKQAAYCAMCGNSVMMKMAQCMYMILDPSSEGASPPRKSLQLLPPGLYINQHSQNHDMITACRYLGLPYYGTKHTLYERLSMELEIKTAEYRQVSGGSDNKSLLLFCWVSQVVRNQVNWESNRYITATQAKNTYNVTDKDLQVYDCVKKPNPHGWGIMRLFRIRDLEEAQLQQRKASEISPSQKQEMGASRLLQCVRNLMLNCKDLTYFTAKAVVNASTRLKDLCYDCKYSDQVIQFVVENVTLRLWKLVASEYKMRLRLVYPGYWLPLYPVGWTSENDVKQVQQVKACLDWAFMYNEYLNYGRLDMLSLAYKMSTWSQSDIRKRMWGMKYDRMIDRMLQVTFLMTHLTSEQFSEFESLRLLHHRKQQSLEKKNMSPDLEDKRLNEECSRIIDVAWKKYKEVYKVSNHECQNEVGMYGYMALRDHVRQMHQESCVSDDDDESDDDCDSYD